MKKLSVVLAVRNEEKNLKQCLIAVQNIAGEIVVVDENSIDDTVAIAQKFGAKVTVVSHCNNFHITKRKAIAMATGEWILQLDADEVVSPHLAQEINRTIKSNPRENGFWIPRRNYFLGKFLKKGGTYPDYTMRLYRNGKGNLPAKSVHEQAVVYGQTGYLKNDLLHYSNRTFGDYIEKRFNRYTDIMAAKIKGGFFRNVFWSPLIDPNQGFLSIYVRHLGFLDGFPGFVWALFSALHFPIAFFKSMDKKNS